jgi:hypothetical protein
MSSNDTIQQLISSVIATKSLPPDPHPEDPRMVSAGAFIKPDLPHDYLVTIRLTPNESPVETPFTDRHLALQLYMAARMRFNDFSQEPENFLVRIFCDGEEFFNNKDHSARGAIIGSGTPIKSDRRLP